MQGDASRQLVSKPGHWLYARAIKGHYGFDSAHELAQRYLAIEGDLRSQIDALIRAQNMRAGASGFVTGLPGAAARALSIPAQMAVSALLQLRMTAAIAIMCGHDAADDQVRIRVCAVVAEAQGAGPGVRATIKKIVTGTPVRTGINAVRTRLGAKLLPRAIGLGVARGAKFAPLVGGLISGGSEAWLTNWVGNLARDSFLPPHGN